MFKIFNQFRKTTINDNSPVNPRPVNRISKYLLYAIGEILLVVIGILIALQINTWNEERKSAEQEILYLERLLAENKQDLETFAMFIKNLEKGNESILAMSRAMKDSNTPDTVLVKSANDYMAFGSIYPVFTSSRSTFEDLSSTGNLKVIKNPGLRDDIVKHYANQEQANKWIQIAVDWALPLDAPFTVDNNAMEFEPHTAFLYPERSAELKAEELRERRMSYISNSAAHLWINLDAIDKLKMLTDETRVLVEKLEAELNEGKH